MTAALLKDRLALVWAGLVIATIVSVLVGHDHAALGQAGAVIVLVIALVKARYVGLEFMELRTAPRVLRGLFEAWCLVVAAMVVVLFLVGS
ncbi:cytochrome C oxidase subunit IV family protein [Actinomycetospora sp. TBRC 11914]|uniref:cytochrome C oxidase subunit IV family protein n=1 Tax=Actinomycetospora sp. TBRC 11914 TaxID=2729387 RepID=UPI00145E9250|nr:cytochrome C oxidase subunit IV family protein [Actinomycetospora sp. TBRC 11914]NMO91683.1 cytochrome C oxidase subunit IV family protein [Actinomycetospora sp. TBRC 11914]